MKNLILFLCIFALSFSSQATRRHSRPQQKPIPSTTTSLQKNEQLLVKIDSSQQIQARAFFEGKKWKTEDVTPNWILVHTRFQNSMIEELSNIPGVEYIQPNYVISLFEKYQIQDRLRLASLEKLLRQKTIPADFEIPSQDHDDPLHEQAGKTEKPVDNPPWSPPLVWKQGVDPKSMDQWGLEQILPSQFRRPTEPIIVAVIDSGIDYTHDDLKNQMWLNPYETGMDAQNHSKHNNQIDDDGNGLVDDFMGWDFYSNDNLPYDMHKIPLDLLRQGGNAGHGTHCAGTIAAGFRNSLGISSLSPNIQVMPVRFLDENGNGTTAGAIRSIYYAVSKGAKILSNSWGYEGEMPSQENKALQEAVAYARSQGVLFIAAAGNGRDGVGINNDTDPTPVYPASYDMDNIISVAAVNREDQLTRFSNFGAHKVHIAAPGARIYSTVPGNRYTDIVFKFYGFEASWDGTSMATPHVAAAAAYIWGMNPNWNYQQVRRALFETARKTPELHDKVLSGGIVDLHAWAR